MAGSQPEPCSTAALSTSRVAGCSSTMSSPTVLLIAPIWHRRSPRRPAALRPFQEPPA